MGISISQLFCPAALYFFLTLAVVLRRENIIYLFALTAPFYEHFNGMFFPLRIGNVSFIVKPFLVLVFLSIGYSLKNDPQLKAKTIIPSELKIAVSGFLVFVALSLGFTFLENTGKLTELLTALNISLLIFISRFYSYRALHVKKLLFFTGIAVLITSSYNVLRFYFPSAPVFAEWKEQTFPLFLMMAFPLICLGFLFFEDKPSEIFFLSCFSMMSFSLLFSASRSAFFTLMLTFPFFFLFVYKISCKKGGILRKIVVLIMILSSTFIITDKSFPLVRGELGTTIKSLHDRSPQLINPDSVTHRIPDLTARNFYAILTHYRTIPWKESIKIFQKAPLRGYGLNFLVFGIFGLHSIYFTVLLASGLIGFLAFFGGLFFIFKSLFIKIKRYNEWKEKVFFLALLFSLFTWLIAGTVQTFLNDFMIWFVMSLVFINTIEFKDAEA